jgi:hypothetical protein
VSITPVQTNSLTLRLLTLGGTIRGQFRLAGDDHWRDAGECPLPGVEGAKANLSLQFYQGAGTAGHWARVSDFLVVERP